MGGGGGKNRKQERLVSQRDGGIITSVLQRDRIRGRRVGGSSVLLEKRPATTRPGVLPRYAEREMGKN